MLPLCFWKENFVFYVVFIVGYFVQHSFKLIKGYDSVVLVEIRDGYLVERLDN